MLNYSVLTVRVRILGRDLRVDKSPGLGMMFLMVGDKPIATIMPHSYNVQDHADLVDLVETMVELLRLTIEQKLPESTG